MRSRWLVIILPILIALPAYGLRDVFHGVMYARWGRPLTVEKSPVAFCLAVGLDVALLGVFLGLAAVELWGWWWRRRIDRLTAELDDLARGPGGGGRLAPGPVDPAPRDGSSVD